jgi:predicted O-methyltransferase YrrM
VSGGSSDLLEKLIWHDDDHLQVNDARFRLTLDWETADRTQSTLDEFLLVKNWWLVQSTLERLPSPITNMVEIGIFKGGSIALYEALLSPKKLVGIELKPERVTALDEYLARRSASDRVRLYYGTDQADAQALGSIARENFGDEPLDLVIDDGSHRYGPSRVALNVLLPRLRPGGVYVIEDWGWAHWPEPEFQEGDGGQYADQRHPLTKLVFEAVMLCASHPGIVTEMFVDPSRAFLTRGWDPVDTHGFDIGRSYLTSKWQMEFARSDEPGAGARRHLVPPWFRKRRPGGVSDAAATRFTPSAR